MENLYRWVKASERLPSKPGLVHYKEEGGLNDVVFYDDKHGFYKPKVFRSKGMSRKSETVIVTINTPPYKIFWLEQVEPLPSDKMEWVDVKESPLYLINERKEWECTKNGDGAFLAAVPYTDKRKPNENLWWIMPCVVEDGTGLCIIGDEENEKAGWELQDVTHYKILDFTPPSG